MSNKIVHSFYEFVCENGGAAADYYKQFNTAIPVLGGVYIGKTHIITETIEIIAIVDIVAIGKVIKDTNNGSSVGTIRMYNNTGLAIGWQYNENRSDFRLKELK
jgi:hypothetical protein